MFDDTIFLSALYIILGVCVIALARQCQVNVKRKHNMKYIIGAILLANHLRRRLLIKHGQGSCFHAAIGPTGTAIGGFCAEILSI